MQVNFKKSQYKCYSWEHSVQVVLEKKKKIKRRSDFLWFAICLTSHSLYRPIFLVILGLPVSILPVKGFPYAASSSFSSPFSNFAPRSKVKLPLLCVQLFLMVALQQPTKASNFGTWNFPQNKKIMSPSQKLWDSLILASGIFFAQLPLNLLNGIFLKCSTFLCLICRSSEKFWSGHELLVMYKIMTA